MKTEIAILAALALLGTSGFAADDEPPRLSHNPFARPPSEELIVQREVREIGDRSGSMLELQATLVGSVNRLANVDGRILKPGDEIDGYVLIAVHERYAVFRRNGENMTVYVKPLQAKDDE